MSKKILKHPDREEIIKRLNEGDSVRKVNAWLKEKYSTNKSLHLSTVTLQSFRKKNLQLDGKVLRDIQEASVVQHRALEEQQRVAQLESTNAYQDKINNIADTHLNVANKILQLDGIIESRMEYWFNAISDGDATPQQADKQLRDYIDRQMVLMQQYKKFVEGMADKTIEHNVNITVMNEQIALIRDVIRDVIASFNSETALLFIEKVTAKLGSLEYAAEPAALVDKNVLTAVEAEIIEDYDD